MIKYLIFMSLLFAFAKIRDYKNPIPPVKKIKFAKDFQYTDHQLEFFELEND